MRFQILTFGLRRFRRWRSSFVNEKKLSQREPAQSERWDLGEDPSAAPASSPRSDPRCRSKPMHSKIPKRAGRARWLQTKLELMFPKATKGFPRIPAGGMGWPDAGPLSPLAAKMKHRPQDFQGSPQLGHREGSETPSLAATTDANWVEWEKGATPTPNTAGCCGGLQEANGGSPL